MILYTCLHEVECLVAQIEMKDKFVVLCTSSSVSYRAFYWFWWKVGNITNKEDTKMLLFFAFEDTENASDSIWASDSNHPNFGIMHQFT